MKVINEIISDKVYLEAISDEVSTTIIENAQIVIILLLKEKYEEAAIVRDTVTLFLLDSAKILSTATGVRTQTLYRNFIKQNNDVLKIMYKKYL